MKRTPTEIAWAGGLFAGEGCFTTNGRTVGARLKMTEEDVVRQFTRAVGTGIVSGPFQPRNTAWKPVWVWTVSSHEKFQAVLAMLWPWLNERRRERAVALLTEYRGQPRRTPYVAPCQAEECGRPHYAKGLCFMHYARSRRAA